MNSLHSTSQQLARTEHANILPWNLDSAKTCKFPCCFCIPFLNCIREPFHFCRVQDSLTHHSVNGVKDVPAQNSGSQEGVCSTDELSERPPIKPCISCEFHRNIMIR